MEGVCRFLKNLWTATRALNSLLWCLTYTWHRKQLPVEVTGLFFFFFLLFIDIQKIIFDMVVQSFNHVWLFTAPWTIVRQAPLPIEFPKQEYWNGLPLLPPGDLPNPGVELASPVAPVFQADSVPLNEMRRNCPVTGEHEGREGWGPNPGERLYLKKFKSLQSWDSKPD